MKVIAVLRVLLLSLFVAQAHSCRTADPSNELKSSKKSNLITSEDGIAFDSFFDLQGKDASLRGKTYLAFMQENVWPAMNARVTKTYDAVTPEQIETAYRMSDKKVQLKVDDWGGVEKVSSMVKGIEDKAVTMQNLGKFLKGNYGLATFVGLAAGDGVKIQYAPKNVAYNVHYDLTEKRSGRSFGTGPERGANDASDKQYLEDLEEVGRRKQDSVEAFYGTIFRTLLALDTTKHQELSPFGQSVATDFLAVYTAEQARNLMDGKVSLHWDAALLEVTLLGAFHSGQSKFQFYYTNPKTKALEFTGQVYKQTPGCDEVTGSTHQAEMHDYWQFSTSSDPKNCKRSGINITKNAFRKMGRRITAYMIKNQNKAYSAVASAIEDKRTENVYESLSKFILLKQGAKELSAERVNQITSAWIQFLDLTKAKADDITKSKVGSAIDTSGADRPLAETLKTDDDQMNGREDLVYEEDLQLMAKGLIPTR